MQLRYSKYTMRLSLLVLLTCLPQRYCMAFGAEEQIENCTSLQIEAENNEMLTKQEKIEQMNNALFDSIDNYETCVSKMEAQAGGGGGGDDEGEGDGGGDGGDSATEGPDGEPLANGSSHPPQPTAQNNGAVPKDIPPADNDSVLQARIRAAAEREKDPVKRKKLWDMFRTYESEK